MHKIRLLHLDIMKLAKEKMLKTFRPNLKFRQIQSINVSYQTKTPTNVIRIQSDRFQIDDEIL